MTKWIYFISVADNIRSVSLIVSLLMVLLCVITAIMWGEDILDGKGVFKGLLFFSFLGIVSISGFVFIPNSKGLAAIYILPKVLENERVLNMGDKAMTIFDEKLDGWLKDLKDEPARN